MKNILIINESCSDNIGDHAINYGLMSLVKNSGNNPISIGFDADKKNERPVEVKEDSYLVSLKKKIRKIFIGNNKPLKYIVWTLRNIKRVNLAINESIDTVIIGGGQLIQSGGTFPIALYIWTSFAKRRKIPIIILGVGCAENFSTMDRWLFRKSFRAANKIAVRDYPSINKLQSFFNTKAEFIPDLAYALYANKTEKIKNNVTIIGATSYYVYLKNLKELKKTIELSLTDYVNSWVMTACNELGKGNDLIFASTTVQDAALNRLIYAKLIQEGHEKRITLIDDVPNTFEYIDILVKAKKVISGRMHSLILGHLSGCIMEPSNINKKIEIYMDEYGRKDPRGIYLNLDRSFKLIINDIF